MSHNEWCGLYASLNRQSLEGRNEERINTERERRRADKVEARVKELEMLLATK